jgi:hypothetical protein
VKVERQPRSRVTKTVVCQARRTATAYYISTFSTWRDQISVFVVDGLSNRFVLLLQLLTVEGDAN